MYFIFAQAWNLCLRDEWWVEKKSSPWNDKQHLICSEFIIHQCAFTRNIFKYNKRSHSLAVLFCFKRMRRREIIGGEVSSSRSKTRRATWKLAPLLFWVVSIVNYDENISVECKQNSRKKVFRKCSWHHRFWNCAEYAESNIKRLLA